MTGQRRDGEEAGTTAEGTTNDDLEWPLWMGITTLNPSYELRGIRMTIETDNNVQFRLGEKTILVRKKDSSPYYFGCEYIEESSLDLNFEDIKRITPESFPENLYISIFFKNNTYKPVDYLEIGKKLGKTHSNISLTFNVSKWDQDIAPMKFLLAYKAEASNEFEINYCSDEITEGFFDISLIFNIPENTTISEAVRTASEKLKKIHINITTRNENEISAHFNFPPQYKHIYSQYLIYFGQFLEDLGVEAKISLESEEDETILRVAPNNKNHALNEISAILATYLDLPNDTDKFLIHASKDWRSESKLLQLNSVIDHLNSQLKLQQAISKVQTANIQLLEQYIRNHDNPKNTIDNSLEPFSGIKITKYKGSFFEIDIPRIAKRIKSILPKN